MFILLSALDILQTLGVCILAGGAEREPDEHILPQYTSQRYQQGCMGRVTLSFSKDGGKVVMDDRFPTGSVTFTTDNTVFLVFIF